MSGDGVRGSVVIPAYNEAAVIGRCLDALFEGTEPHSLEVVVACNGCTDGTASAVARTGHPVTVVQLDAPSKPGALRAAETVAERFPRIYLDADVVLPGASARAVLDRLTNGPALAARPTIRYDTAGSSPSVRRYYTARTRLPSVMASIWGAGVYGLSAKGRARFAAYPDVVADDLFVDRQFARHEIEIIESCPPAVVTAPASARGLLGTLRRTYRGNAEAASDAPPARTTPPVTSDLRRLAAEPLHRVDALTYALFAVAGRAMVRVPGRRGWERDDTSRTGRGER